METVKDNLRKQPGPWISFEKKRIEELRYNITNDSILLYEDEKGPIVAKTYGGTTWSSVQSKKVSKDQKIRGILNVFGVYDHTNNQMWTHGYQRKTGTQSLDFIDRIDQKYDSTVKQIFLILDNVSIHKSNKVKQTITKCYPKEYTLYFFQPDYLSSIC